MNIDNMLKNLYNGLIDKKEIDYKLVEQKYSGIKLDTVKAKIEHDFKFNLEKLKKSTDVKHENQEVQERFITMYGMINQADDCFKQELILTYASGLVEIDGVKNLDDESSLTFAKAIKCLPLSDYNAHGIIMSNERILKKLSSLDEDDFDTACDDIFDYCDSNIDDSMDDIRYNNCINDCEGIIGEFIFDKQL